MQIDISVDETRAQEGAFDDKSISTWRIFFLVYSLGLVIALLNLDDVRGFLGDIDDRMRELQIRHFFSASGSWYDLSLPMISTPEVYSSPWSRLIDLPYVAITLLLTPLFGAERAIAIAFNVWPPMMLSLFSLLVAMILRRQLRKSAPLSYAIIATVTILMALAIWEFVPGRIDHHNMQIIGLMTVLAGLQKWNRSGGILVGLGTVVCFVISLEGLPFIAVAFAGVIACFIFDIKGACGLLRAAAMTILLLTLPAAFTFIGLSGIGSMQCDAFSAPYIALAIGCSAVLVAGTTALAGKAPYIRLLGLALPTAAVLTTTGAVFPRCLAGPYWMIDPVSKANWLDRVSQEHSFLYFLQQGQFYLVALLAMLCCIAVLAAPMVFSDMRKRPENAIIFAIAATALLLTLLQTRNIRFAFAFIPLLLPLALEFASRTSAAGASVLKVTRTLVAAAIFLIVVAAVALRVIVPATPQHYDAIDYMAFDECVGQDFSTLSGEAPGRIAVPLGLGLPLAFSAPQGFSVAAVPFHRAAPGIKRMLEALTTHDSTVRRAALQPFDYLAVCKFPLAVDANQAPLYAELAKGGSWPGLELIPPSVPTNFQLFRINHETLR